MTTRLAIVAVAAVIVILIFLAAAVGPKLQRFLRGPERQAEREPEIRRDIERWATRMAAARARRWRREHQLNRVRP